MKELALYSEYALYGLFALTVALIAFKTLDLWATRLIRGKPVGDFLGTSAASVDVGMERLESGMTLLATIASTAPFLGLAATIMHISSALSLLDGPRADALALAVPIGEALKVTLVGLAAALPAAVFYNLGSARLRRIENRQFRIISGASREA